MPPTPPGPTRSVLAREVLLHRMQDFSEDCFCAGWLGGLEFLLWEVPADDDEVAAAQGRRKVVEECWVLAEIAGGWWVYADESVPADRGPVFITIA